MRWHKHHIIPRHMGGTNEPHNLVKVNTTMHAFLHKCLWEEYGKREDFIAWKMLSGQITRGDIRVGAKHSEESKELIRQKAIGRKASTNTKEKMSVSRKKWKHKPESIQKWADAQAKEYVFIGPNGDIIKFRNLNKYCRDNNLCRVSLRNVATGYKGKTEYKGYKLCQ